MKLIRYSPTSCQDVVAKMGGHDQLVGDKPPDWRCNSAAAQQGAFVVQAHRDGCMCIICKQARRVGKTWGGMTGMPPWQAPMLTQGPQAGRGNPQPRFGKRAFLHALPQLVCGPLKHKVHRLPLCAAPHVQTYRHNLKR